MSDPLLAFHQAAARLWENYLAHGPGKLDPQLWLLLTREYERIKELGGPLPTEIDYAVEMLVKLSRRCAERPEGLCFVTGEAGLVTRWDEHQRFDEALAIVHRHCDQQFDE